MERSVVEALENVLSPVNVLLFARSVEEAAVMVIFAEPSKEVPLMLRAVARTVAAPAVKLAPVPVMLVPTKADGVPRAGVTRVGELENTTLPVPVSSESHCEKCCEVEKSEEVAVSTQALPSYSKRSPYAAAVVVVSVRESRSVTLLPPMQVPLIDTHPPVRLMPLANVLVADVPVILRYVEARAPENVEVELVPATFRMPWMVEVPVVLLWRVEVAAVPEVLPTYSLSKMERREVEALPKTLSPVNVLLFARSVEEAAVMVMSALPLKEVPLMLRAVARTVAAPAVREAAVPEMLVPTKAEGVPRAGVTRVGELENTTLPVPVSSESHCEKCCEVEKREERSE